jgi:hypothetical protein
MYTFQALVILIYGVNHTHGQCWALLGTTKHIALSLGCHLDPEVFHLDIVEAEERRRCWAALQMLHTIQNTSMGNLDSAKITSNVSLPLDVNDAELVSTNTTPTSSNPGPSQMSYLLLKFKLYGICEKICSALFNKDRPPNFTTILQLDSEIKVQQDEFHDKYVLQTSIYPLSAFQEVHLHILIGYSHQLMLLLHRSVLTEEPSSEAQDGYLLDDVLLSTTRCVESSLALISIHQTLKQVDRFRPYQWYNHGLGSFHAFHATVCLLYIIRTRDYIDAASRDRAQSAIRTSVDTFSAIESSGLSHFCTKAAPVLRGLL